MNFHSDTIAHFHIISLWLADEISSINLIFIYLSLYVSHFQGKSTPYPDDQF